MKRGWRRLAALLAAIVAAAGWAGWRADQPSHAPRRDLASAFASPGQFATRANYLTYWERDGVVRPVFRAAETSTDEFLCEMAEQDALAGEGWRTNGQLTLNTRASLRGTVALRLRLNADGPSFYALGTDRRYTRTPFRVGGIEQPVASGTADLICLYHATNGQPNASGTAPFWYCALGFDPRRKELRLTEAGNLPQGADLSQGIVPVRITNGLCRAAGKGSESAPLPPPPSESLRTEPTPDPVPPPPPPPPPQEPVATRPYVGSSSTICSTSLDGREVWCGPDATICSSTLNGQQVACGGRATICTSSLNGNDVACGGEATICTSSLKGNDVACGGRATICTSSLKGNDVACGGEATICTTSLDGRDAACGGRASYCTSSLKGARACGKGTYSSD